MKAEILRYIICNNKDKGSMLKIKDFKKAEEGDQQLLIYLVDVFNIIIYKRPNIVVHLKVDEAMEGCRSHKEVRSR